MICSLIKYYSGGQIKNNAMGDTCGTYSVLVGRHDRKRLPGRLRHRWQNKTEMDLQEM
jgi:hypothetical protein